MTFTTVSSLSGVTAGGNLPAAGVQLHVEDVFDGVYIRDPATSTGLPTGYCQWTYGLPGGPGKITDVTPFLPGGSPGSGYTALNISAPGSSDVLNEYIATDAFTAFYYMTPSGFSVPAGGFIGARAQNPTTVFSTPPTLIVAGTGGTGCVPIAILGVPVPSDSRMIIATGPNGSLNYGAGTISANSVQELFENGGVYVIPVSSGGGGGGATTLSSLTDVSISGLANGDGLFFSTVDNKWHNTSPTTFGAGLLGNASDGTTGNISLVNLTYTPLSTETGGVAGTLTATASGGGGSPDIFDPFLVAMKTSSWYGPPVSSGGVSTAAFAFNTLYATPIPLLAGTVIKKYGCHIVTANQFNFNIEFGLFADTGNGAPGNLVSGSYSGTVSVTAGASGDFTTVLGSSFTIAQSGWYWIAVNTSATGATISCVSTGNVSPMITRLIGGTSTAQALSGPACGYAMTQASGSMPSTFSSTPTVLSVNCLAGAIGT